jgi:hypothetical protein
MKRAFASLASSFALAGCASWSVSDYIPSLSAPTATTVLQLDSNPPGAEARTSGGQACKTPCALNVPMEGDFTVTYSLAGYLPQTVAVSVTQGGDVREAGDSGAVPPPQLNPNPAVAQLEPAPPPRPAKKTKTKAAPKAPPKT